MKRESIYMKIMNLEFSLDYHLVLLECCDSDGSYRRSVENKIRILEHKINFLGEVYDQLYWNGKVSAAVRHRIGFA